MGAEVSAEASVVPMMLRPYQHDVIAEVEAAVAAGQRRIIVVAPTGSGKTVVAAEIIRRELARGRSSLFLAHRREIIAQTSERLTEHGMPLGVHGVILAGRDAELRPQALVQVASIDTLLARAIRRDAMRLPQAAIVIFDEAHRVRGRTRERLLKQYPDAILIGLTATPCRADGRGLGNLFEVMLVGPQVSELTKIGALVPAKVYGPVRSDVTKGVGTSQGDYVISQLSRRMNTDVLVGDIVRDWLAHGEGRPTVVFAVDIAHSVNIRNQFVGAGVPAEHLDCNTPTEQRAQILRRLAAGEIKVVSNAMVLTEAGIARRSHVACWRGQRSNSAPTGRR
jgi:DNA repair protein RadD